MDCSNMLYYAHIRVTAAAIKIDNVEISGSMFH